MDFWNKMLLPTFFVKNALKMWWTEHWEVSCCSEQCYHWSKQSIKQRLNETELLRWQRCQQIYLKSRKKDVRKQQMKTNCQVQSNHLLLFFFLNSRHTLTDKSRKKMNDLHLKIISSTCATTNPPAFLLPLFLPFKSSSTPSPPNLGWIEFYCCVRCLQWVLS